MEVGILLLQVKNLNKSFLIPDGIFKKSKHHVLKDISLEMLEGECLGIIGESGSGKSTLGRLIMGIDKQDSGEIVFTGKSNRDEYQHERSFRHCGAIRS